MCKRARALATILFCVLCISPAWADTLADIQKRGSLRWGGDASGGGPYVYQGPENTLVGFEYELMEYVARELGVRSEYVNWEWEMLPQKLKQGGIDLVLNGYEWSEEFERETPSTVPYYIYKLQLLARTDDDSIRSWDDLRAEPGQVRKRVGALQGSAAARYLEKEFGGAIDLKKYPELTMVMGLVEHGQLDATLQDIPTVHVLRPRIPRSTRRGRASSTWILRRLRAAG